MPSDRAVVLRMAEIFLKGGNRHLFVDKLVENVHRVLHGMSSTRVERLHARVLVHVSEAEAGRVLERLGRVFGVVSLSPARVVEKDFEAIAAEAVRAATEAVSRRGGKKPTFKVETRRPDKHFRMNSPEVSREVGARIVQALELPVDVHRPELEIGIEIGDRTFVYHETVPGPGGLPVGTSGLVNLLLSGGIDSPVAGWLTMKRGLRIMATYFHSFPYTGDRTKQKVIDLVRLLSPWHGPITLRVVGFTDVQKALREAGPAELAVVLYRRMMLRAAAKLAAQAHAPALVTGDNLAQVASQTLENLVVIEEAAGMPVLRPLLTNDKLETIALAQRIGTYETSIQPYEDCCSLFVPAHPATRSRLDVVKTVESRIDVDQMATSLANDAERLVIE